MPLTEEVRTSHFDIIKKALCNCCPPMKVSKDKEGVYELMGNKPVSYGSKKVMVPGMYFSSVVARKAMISFYFFPIYFHEPDFIDLIPNMKKYLKGKTCFNFKKADQVDEKELNNLLMRGVKAWSKLGYLTE
ncbi:MAG: hypothetical protein NVS3B19_16840 [Ginsengibacter sp.]